MRVSPTPPRRDVTVYVTASGWHTGIALPTRLINGPLRKLLPSFPGADHLLIGWGERDYYMAEEPNSGDALRALFPGPAVLLVTPLDRPPHEAPNSATIFAVGLSMAGFDRLADYVWAAFDTSAEGKPRRVDGGASARRIFYAATGTYSAAYTCNTWIADGLRIGGLPITAAGIVFAHQVVDQLQSLPGIAD